MLPSEHAKKDKAEATASALRQLAAGGRSWGVNRRRLRHRSLCRPQEGEPRAVMESAHEDRRESSVGHGPQEGLGLWEGCSAGEAGASQLCRRRRGNRPGQRPLEDQHCRERRSGIAHSPRHGRPGASSPR